MWHTSEVTTLPSWQNFISQAVCYSVHCVTQYIKIATTFRCRNIYSHYHRMVMESDGEAWLKARLSASSIPKSAAGQRTTHWLSDIRFYWFKDLARLGSELYRLLSACSSKLTAFQFSIAVTLPAVNRVLKIKIAEMTPALQSDLSRVSLSPSP